MIERRYKAGSLTVDTRADGRPVITGYAAVFFDAADAGTEYRLWSDVVERIQPGAFDDAIGRDDVRALYNHDPSAVLGRNKAGTLRLSVDAKGLRYEIDPPDTETAREVLELIRRGDITGSSFGFVPDVTSFREDGETTIVIREKVRLYDVSPVTFPAYEATSAGVRSDGTDNVREEVTAWRVKRAAGKAVPRDVVKARARLVELTR